MAEELTWDEHAWPATGMDKTIDPDLAARLREESEQTKDEPYPTDVKVARPNRAKVYSVRLSAEEQEAVERVAHAQHLPVSAEEQEAVERVAHAQHLPASTLVRAWILERLDRERSA